MLWVPIVSILIFALSLVPAFIYGFKIGWRASLFISVVLFALVISFVLTTYFTYETTIWPWWGNFYLSSEIKSGSGISVDLFKTVRSIKNTGVMFATGCFTPIAVLITLSIYKFVKRPLNKYLGHKTTNVNDSINEKSIIIKKNRKPAKIIGGGVIVANTVFVAAVVTSAVNVLTVPVNRRNGFNKTTDFIAGIYGGSMAQNSEEAMVIRDFMHNLDSQVNKALVEYTNLSSKEENEDFLNKKTLEGVYARREIFQKLFESENASYELFKALIKGGSQIDPLFFDQNTVNASEINKNQVGYNYNEKYHTLSNVATWLNSNKHLIDDLKMPKKVRKLFLNRVKELMISFESTIFNQNVENANSVLMEARQRLQDQIDELNSLKSENHKCASERKELVTRTLNGLLGSDSDPSYVEYLLDDAKNKGPSTGIDYKFNENNKLINDEEIINDWFHQPADAEFPDVATFDGNASKITNTNGGKIHDAFDTYITLRKDYLEKLAIFRYFNKVWRDHLENKYNPAKYLLESKKQITSSMASELKQLQNEKASNEATAEKAENTINSSRTQLAKNEKDVIYVESEITREKEILSNDTEAEKEATTKRDAARSEFHDAESLWKKKHDELRDIEDKIIAINNLIDRDEKDLTNKNNWLSDSHAKSNSLTSEISNKSAEILNIENQIKTIDGKVSDLKASLIQANDKQRIEIEKEIASLNSKNENLKNTLQPKMVEKNSLVSEKSDLDVKIRNIESAITEIKNNINTNKEKLANLKLGKSRAENDYNTIDKEYKSKSAIYNNLENLLIKATKKRNNTLSTLSALGSRKNALSNSITELERTIASNTQIRENAKKRIDELDTKEIPEAETKLRTAQSEQKIAQEAYDKEEGIRRANESKKTEKDEIQKSAETKVKSQWKTLSDLISKYNQGIDRLETLNATLKDQEQRYVVLTNEDVQVKKRADEAGANGSTISKPLYINEFTDGYNTEQTDAIYFTEQKIRFLEAKLQQLIKIKENKKVIFDKNKEELINLYQNWLNL